MNKHKNNYDENDYCSLDHNSFCYDASIFTSTNELQG